MAPEGLAAHSLCITAFSGSQRCLEWPPLSLGEVTEPTGTQLKDTPHGHVRRTPGNLGFGRLQPGLCAEERSLLCICTIRGFPLGPPRQTSVFPKFQSEAPPVCQVSFSNDSRKARSSWVAGTSQPLLYWVALAGTPPSLGLHVAWRALTQLPIPAGGAQGSAADG